MSSDETFGTLKKTVTDQLSDVSSLIDSLLKGEGSLLSNKKKLENFIADDSSKISENEQKFVDSISTITDSLKGINGIVNAVELMANAGCPAIPKVSQAESGTEEYVKLANIKLWAKFRDMNSPAYLIDINNNKYVNGSNALFYVKIVNSPELQEPKYRADFNTPPYQDDNKTVYLYLGEGFSVLDENDNVIQPSKYSIKNLRTVVSNEEYSDCIYVYKNTANTMCAKLLFDVYYPSSDDEEIGYPKDYFSVEVTMDYDSESNKYSLRVVNNL